jgi:FkbM family methyltransferase
MRLMLWIKSKTKHFYRTLLSLSGYELIKLSKYKALVKTDFFGVWDRWAHNDVSPELLGYIIKNYQKSYSQLQQDLWALYEYKEKYKSDLNGYFVEFGATDGRTLSNTFILEKNYNWRGILVEPSKSFENSLRTNRTSIIDSRCVFSESGTMIDFNEVEVGELSGIASHQNLDGWSKHRDRFISYKVKTVTLNDLLLEHNAPKIINYMSIDTEGSEYEILKNFPFERWVIEVLTIEHNFTQNEVLIEELLISQGYRRRIPKTSCWDSWYVLEN